MEIKQGTKKMIEPRSEQSFALEHGLPRLLPLAVVGFIDMVSSCRISQLLDAGMEWQMKARFFLLAGIRAEKHGIEIINTTGDGFLYLIREGCTEASLLSVIDFYDGLKDDFQEILSSYGVQIAAIESGLRAGVAIGPIAIGIHGKGESGQLTAAGKTVNLASRLCDQAGRNQLVISDQAWDIGGLGKHFQNFSHKSFNSLKGFQHVVHAIEVHGIAESDRQIPRPAPKSLESKQEEIDLLLKSS